MAARGLKVLGVLAGEHLPAATLRAWATDADVILAADRGADRLLEAGCRVDVLLGDMDSASEEARRAAGRVISIENQDLTDCDKLLAFAHGEGYGEISIASIEGSLPDHQLASLHSVARAEIRSRIVYTRGLAYVLRGPTEFSSAHEGRISLLPITECEGIALSGVRWPLEGALSPTGMSSISNEGLGRIEIRIAAGVAFLFMETEGAPRWD